MTAKILEREGRKPRRLPFFVEGGGPITRNWFISSHIGRAIFARCCPGGEEGRGLEGERRGARRLFTLWSNRYMYTWYIGWSA